MTGTPEEQRRAVVGVLAFVAVAMVVTIGWGTWGWRVGLGVIAVACLATAVRIHVKG